MFSTVFPIKGSWRGRSSSFVRDLEDRCGLYLWPTIAKENVGSFVLIRWGFDRLPAIFKHLPPTWWRNLQFPARSQETRYSSTQFPGKTSRFPSGLRKTFLRYYLPRANFISMLISRLLINHLYIL